MPNNPNLDLEQLLHWQGNRKFAEGYEKGLYHFTYLYPEIYEEPTNYPKNFIEGYKTGKKRAKMHQLITGEHYGRATKV